MIHYAVLSQSIILSIENSGRVWEVVSCSVGCAHIEIFQDVNLRTRRPALIPIEEIVPSIHEPGSCEFRKIYNPKTIKHIFIIETFLFQGKNHNTVLLPFS